MATDDRSGSRSYGMDALRGIVDTQREMNSVALDAEELMRVITERAQSLTGAAAGVLELVDGDEMVYRAASGSAADFLGSRLLRASSLSGLCVDSREPLMCTNSETDPRVDREACRRIGVGSMIVVPLMRGEEAVGVLKVMAPEPDRFRSSHVEILRELAGFMADSLIHAARHRDETHRASHDRLTGLPNRAMFMDTLGREWQRGAGGTGRLTLFLVDLDGFKAVNDTFGHAAGDRVLRSVASVLASAVRDNDTVARLGGDEFVVLCPGATSADAVALSERIVGAIERVAEASAEATGLDASIGVAWRTEEYGSPEELLEAADASMYRVKRAVKQ